MTLYIYRVGRTYPARNPVYRSKSIKISSCTRTLPGPVKPVGHTGQTGRPLPDRPQCLDRSDRSVIPVRPVSANFAQVLLKSMLKQLVWAATPSSLLLTSLARSPLVVPLPPSCAYVAAFASEYETSLRDTTSAVNTLNLAPYSSHSPCCNQHLA